MTKKQLPYCPAWTPTPTGDGGRFYCIQPEGHGGQHISPTSNPGAVRHDLEWVIYGTSEGQEIVDLRASLAAEKVRADKVERENAALRKVLEAAREVFHEKRPGYHDCIDDGLPECEWCLLHKALNTLAELDAGEGK